MLLRGCDLLNQGVYLCMPTGRPHAQEDPRRHSASTSGKHQHLYKQAVKAKVGYKELG